MAAAWQLIHVADRRPRLGRGDDLVVGVACPLSERSGKAPYLIDVGEGAASTLVPCDVSRRERASVARYINSAGLPWSPQRDRSHQSVPMSAILFGFLLLIVVVIWVLYGGWVAHHPDRPWFDFIAHMQTGLGALVGFYGLMLVEATRIRNERQREETSRLRDAQGIGVMLGWEISKALVDLIQAKRNLCSIKQDRLRGTMPSDDAEVAATLGEDEFARIMPPPTPVFAGVLTQLGMPELAPVRQPVALFYEKYDEARALAMSELGRPGSRIVPISHLDAVLDSVGQALEYGEDAKAAVVDRFLPQNQRLIDAQSRSASFFKPRSPRLEIDAGRWAPPRATADVLGGGSKEGAPLTGDAKPPLHDSGRQKRV